MDVEHTYVAIDWRHMAIIIASLADAMMLLWCLAIMVLATSKGFAHVHFPRC